MFCGEKHLPQWNNEDFVSKLRSVIDINKHLYNGLNLYLQGMTQAMLHLFEVCNDLY